MINQTNTESSAILNKLYAELHNWLPCQKAYDLTTECFRLGNLTWDEIELYREKRGIAKYLADEIIPVLDHLKYLNFVGDVKFQMDSDVPDAWIRMQDGTEIGLEVTVAASRAQVEGGRVLNKNGCSFGSPSLPDEASKKEYEIWENRDPALESVEVRKQFMKKEILQSLGRKNNEKYSGMHLLVQFDNKCLQKRYWEFLIDDLKDECLDMPFAEIHLIAKTTSSEEPFGFHIK